MAIDTHVRRGHPILFGLLIVLGIVELAITSWLTSRYNARHDYPNTSTRDRIRFLLFASIWTVVFSAVYLALFLHSATGSVMTSVGSHAGFLILTWIWWTAGAASLTASLGGGNNCSKIDFNLPYCNQLNAAEGFAWAEWIITTIALIVTFVLAVRAVRRGDGYRGQLITV